MGKYREPQSANEAALQNLLGEQNELREPQSPVEFYLQELIEQGGGGSSLPEVTSEDNGKVLKVEDGEWGKGGVSAVYVVLNGTLGNDTTTIDCNYDTFIQALKTFPVFLYENGGSSSPYTHIISYDDTTHNIIFYGTHTDSGFKGFLEYNVEPDSSDQNHTRLSFVSRVTGVVKRTLSPTTILNLSNELTVFLGDALQAPGEMVTYSTQITVGNYDASAIVLLMATGQIPEFEFRDITIRPNGYTVSPSMTGFEAHVFVPQFQTESVNITGWFDMFMTNNFVIFTGAFKILS